MKTIIVLQHNRNQQGTPVSALSRDFSLMRLGDRSRNRQANAVPARFGIPGLVRPVKSLEEVRKAVLWDFLCGIIYGKPNIFSRSEERRVGKECRL